MTHIQLDQNYRNKCIFYTFCLKDITKNYTFPKELIRYIIAAYWNSIYINNNHLSCSGNNITLSTSNGLNAYGSYAFDLINFTEKVRFIRSGHNFIIIVTNTNVYGCGHNQLGQLGLGDYNERQSPNKIAFPSDIEILDVKCGDKHTMFLTNQGLFTCGDNISGQLGFGYYSAYSYNTPHKVHIDHIDSISCGRYETIITIKNEFYRFYKVGGANITKISTNGMGDAISVIHGKINIFRTTTGYYVDKIHEINRIPFDNIIDIVTNDRYIIMSTKEGLYIKDIHLNTDIDNFSKIDMHPADKILLIRGCYEYTIIITKFKMMCFSNPIYNEHVMNMCYEVSDKLNE